MRKRLLAIAGLVFGVSILSIEAQQQLTVFARIVDGKGAPVATLEPADVSIKENNVEVKVVKIEPVNWPLKVQVLVDNGAGLGNDNLSNLRTGVRGLIEALPEATELTLVTTAPQARIVVKATTDRMAQLKGVDLLTPDGGSGRFVESLNEAMQRFEKDKTDFFPVIIAAATTSGDTNNLENAYKQLLKRLEQKPTTVHVALFSKGANTSASAGAVQTEVGINVTKFMGGRFESINAGTRLATLLQEFGAQVAKSQEGQSHQFRITVARPNGASGSPGGLSMAATRAGLSVASLTMDGRIP
ncbi:MAG TPA: hypothetical protein VKB50_14615 [Vicinamibacterales bacterium]|nr:hypothetical protein [Vicinamibacterales bacterium]